MMLVDAFRVMMMPMVLAMTWLSVDKKAGTAFNDSDYLLYYLAVPIVAKLTECWTVNSIPEEIRNGTLSRHLLKPLHPLWFHVMEHFSQKALQIFHLVPVVAVFGWALSNRLPALELGFWHIILLGCVLTLGIILRFAMTTAIAMTGFWIERVENLNLVLNAAVWAMLGGLVIPLETLPSWLRWVTDLLPYRYSLSFPIEILAGRIAAKSVIFGLAMTVLWSMFFFMITRDLWQRGLKIYTAYGG